VPDPAPVLVPGVADPPAVEPEPAVAGGTGAVPEPDPLPIVDPPAVEPVPGMVVLPAPEVGPGATFGHFWSPGVVVLPAGGVCWALAVSAIVKTPTVSAVIANRFMV
jgi:hypothetical protein